MWLFPAGRVLSVPARCLKFDEDLSNWKRGFIKRNVRQPGGGISLSSGGGRNLSLQGSVT